MKFHKDIALVGQGSKSVYNSVIVRDLYTKKKYGYRKLSIMKQENFRVSIHKIKYSLRILKSNMATPCGYCFKFHNGINCGKCTLIKDGLMCTWHQEWFDMRQARTKKQFAEAHKKWCKKLGLWQKGWK